MRTSNTTARREPGWVRSAATASDNKVPGVHVHDAGREHPPGPGRARLGPWAGVGAGIRGLVFWRGDADPGSSGAARRTGSLLARGCRPAVFWRGEAATEALWVARCGVSRARGG